MLEQTKKLYEIFSESQIEKINSIINQMVEEGENYKTTALWEFDKTLGGIGGYCQGCNPSLCNPFQGTEFRNVYRSLQYVRSDFDLCNINDVARYTIENCGHHFEEVIKLYLKKKKIFKWIKVSRYPLGKLLQYVATNKIFENRILNKLKLFIDIYNISKHEILSDGKLDRTFHADDAILCYLACRVVGREILLEIDEERAKNIYEIDWNKYGRKVNF